MRTPRVMVEWSLNVIDLKKEHKLEEFQFGSPLFKSIFLASAKERIQCQSQSFWAGTIRPLVPDKSIPEFPSLIQSIKECPGFNAHLFRGFPVADPELCNVCIDGISIFEVFFSILVAYNKKKKQINNHWNLSLYLTLIICTAYVVSKFQLITFQIYFYVKSK